MRCVEGQQESRKKRHSPSNQRPFHLNYGDSGVEMFNVLTSSDGRDIEKLAKCVQAAYPAFFHIMLVVNINQYSNGAHGNI